MAVRDARQPLEEGVAEHLVLPTKQLAGGQPGHLAERLVHVGQHPDARRRLAALERPTAAAAAPVLDPARLPPLPDQAVDLCLRQPRRLGQEAPHRALVTLAKPLATKPPKPVPDERVGALPVPVFIVHGPVAFHEGSNLPDAA